jgi:hypothetical protein
MTKTGWTSVVLLGILAMLVGCSSSSSRGQDRLANANTPFTHGNVTLNLRKGQTTQLEVLNTFGAPNVATTNAKGNEVWTYQKNARVASGSSSEGYLTVVLAGVARSKTNFEESSRSMTLIIHFNEKKVVEDFMSRYSSF